jgi:hypothetical protein
MRIEPVRTEQFLGSVAEGGAVNFRDVYFNPHGHGTHTENVGHIVDTDVPVVRSIGSSHYMAKLISVELRQGVSQGRSEGASQDLPQDLPQNLPHDLSKNLPQDLPTDLPTGLSKNLPTDLAKHLTSLGRDGADFSAAIFAYLLNADSVTIWKDVPGLLNADPKCFMPTQLLKEISFREAVELAYYGASVIHPRTIKPLQNKNIPLYVKCFADASLPGTVIHNNPVKNLPPIIVVKKDQVLMQLQTKDFAFIGEQPMSDLYEIMAGLKIKPNLIQTHAVSLQLCLDDRTEKIEKLALQASHTFDVQVEKGLTLLSIRHYTEQLLQQLTEGKTIEMQQQSPDTVQVLLK